MGYEWDEAALDLGGGISMERDYESRFVNLGGRMDFNQKQTTLNLGLSYTHSTVEPAEHFGGVENLVADRSVLNTHATIYGGALHSADDRSGSGGGWVLNFDGGNDFVLVQNFDYPYGSSVTVEAWIKPDAVDGQRMIWDDGNPGVQLAIVDGKAQFVVTTPNNPAFGFHVSGGTVCAGKWQHIAGIYDGGTLRVFVNGVQAASEPASGDEFQNTSRAWLKIPTYTCV